MPKVKPPSGFLAGALARKRSELALARRKTPREELERMAADRRPARSLSQALRGVGVAVIAEVKRRSPSAGPLDSGIDAPARARLFEERGAAAVSVLTDAEFEGRLEDLAAVAAAVSVPVIRKDFLVDPWQVWESRAAGADAALVIVAATDSRVLGELMAAGANARLGLLIEIHDEEEGRTAIDSGATLIGVNARDLSTLAVDVESALATIEWLRREAPGAVIVAESGIASVEEVRRASQAGADAVLVGEHLSRAAHPGDALLELVTAGREADGPRVSASGRGETPKT